MPKPTRNEPERHICVAPNILRDKMDSAEFKKYILGMIFLKRLSDVFDEEALKILRELATRARPQGLPVDHSVHSGETLVLMLYWEAKRRLGRLRQIRADVTGHYAHAHCDRWDEDEAASTARRAINEQPADATWASSIPHHGGR